MPRRMFGVSWLLVLFGGVLVPFHGFHHEVLSPSEHNPFLKRTTDEKGFCPPRTNKPLPINIFLHLSFQQQPQVEWKL